MVVAGLGMVVAAMAEIGSGDFLGLG
ncbi:hypothetical protein A2U01_0055435, partial [Trifolium medium]|nr:hypothetical protein [Trifolium medium]